MNEKLKLLNISTVEDMAEKLILANGWTTTLEVKNALRRLGYYAIQSEVSAAMDFLAMEKGWVFTWNGTFRIYEFGSDTDGSLYKAMYKSDRFWEIAVRGKDQIIRLGKSETKAGIFTTRFDSNRQAMAEANRLIGLRQEEGFQAFQHPVVTEEQVLSFFDYMNKVPLQCTLFFHSIQQEERQKGILSHNQMTGIGWVQTLKKAGYEFTFDCGVAKMTTQMREILEHSEWDAQGYPLVGRCLLGEKVVKETSCFMSGQKKNGNQLMEALSNSKITKLKVRNENLYRADIQFRDGDRLVLRKSNLPEKSFLPILNILVRLA